MNETPQLRTENLPQSGMVTDLLGHRFDGGKPTLARVPVAALAASMAVFATRVVIATRAELLTLTDYPVHSGAEVVNDSIPGANGIYRKIAVFGSPGWARQGDLRPGTPGPAGPEGRPAPLAMTGRPGDYPSAYTTSLDDGGTDDLAPIDDGAVVFGDAGRAVRLAVEGVIATRRVVPLEPDRTFRARFVLTRRTNSRDPSNDAVRLGVLWLDQAKTAIGSTAIVDLTALTVGSGRQSVTGLVSRNAAPGILSGPAGARYVRLFVERFGNSAVDDVEVIDVEDVTAANLLDPVSTGLSARVAAIESGDLGDRLDAVESAVAGPRSLIFETRGAAEAAAVPASVTTLRLTGINAAGDGGEGLYRRVASNPATNTSFQTADGAYFLLVLPDALSPPALSSKPFAAATGQQSLSILDRFAGHFINVAELTDGTGSVANDTAAVLSAIDRATTTGRAILLTRMFNIGQTISADALGLSMAGIGPEMSGLRGTPGIGSMLRINGPEQRFQGFKLDANGTASGCIFITRLGLAPKVVDAKLEGDVAGQLLYSIGDIVELREVTWGCNSPQTVASVWNAHNQNCSIIGGRVGGPGCGHRIIRTNLSDPRVEGFRITSHFTINTGDFNVFVGDSYETVIGDSVLDQGSGSVMRIGEGATSLRVSNTWLGCSSNTGSCVTIEPDAGSSLLFNGGKMNGGLNQFVVKANGAQRVSDVSLAYVGFTGPQSTSLLLDSVNGFLAMGCRGAYAPNGSWNTSQSHPSGGYYQFDHNRWSGPQATRAGAPSVHLITNDTGITA